MQRWLGVVIVIGLAAPAAADKCLSIKDATAVSANATADNELSLGKALDKRKLKLVKLVRQVKQQTRMQPLKYKPNDVVTVDAKRLVYIGTFQMCGAPTDTEFVQHDSKVYRLDRAPKYSSKRIEACECYFPGYRCGGAVPPMIDLMYELPDGTTFEGAVTVEYDASDPQIVGGVASKKACVPPPPPP